MIRCVFFDRDGIINESPGAARYVTSWDGFRFIPEFAAAARVAIDRGYQIIIITNQSAVAKGLVTEEVLSDIHSRLRKLLSDSYGIRLLDIIYCPHNPGQCNCRKPEPGMLMEAARRHDVDLAASWMIGDAETDMLAGERAGCHTVLVGRRPEESRPDFLAEDMNALTGILEKAL